MRLCGLRWKYIGHYMKFVRLGTPQAPVSKRSKQSFAPLDFRFQQTQNLRMKKIYRYPSIFPRVPNFAFRIPKKTFNSGSADLTWKNRLMGKRMIAYNSFLMIGKEG